MKNFNELIDRGYKAVKKTGKIGIYTSIYDFLNKIEEEYNETEKEFEGCDLYCDEITDRQAEEITDIIETCINMLVHYQRDPIKEIEKVVLKNEKRAINSDITK